MGTGSERGWLCRYLCDGDDLFGHGRMGWWFQSVGGELPSSPIPQIRWRNASDRSVRPEHEALSEHLEVELSADGARRHVVDLIDRMGGGWEALLYLIRWIAWGLAVSSEEEPPRAHYSASEGWDEMLRKEFQLGRLQAADADVLGAVLSDRHAGGWNPNAFYPTPLEVCECMVQVVMGDVGVVLEDGRDARLASVMDPCVGTGRMLLAASNRTVNLWGGDIDPTMVDACAVNMALYAPWVVYMSREQRAMLGRPPASTECDQRSAEVMDGARVAQGHGPLPSETPTTTTLCECGHAKSQHHYLEKAERKVCDYAGHACDCKGYRRAKAEGGGKVYSFDRKGQGDLFAFGKVTR